jgi:hypothetical protein
MRFDTFNVDELWWIFIVAFVLWLMIALKYDYFARFKKKSTENDQQNIIS